MDLDEWLPLYDEIVTALGLSVEDDEEATRILNLSILNNSKIEDRSETFNELSRMIKGSSCFVFGTSPSLEKEVEGISSHLRSMRNRPILIAADGAASILLENGFTPDVIVTDLDGGINDQMDCLSRGSFMILHGHGDNMEVIARTIPKMSGKVLQSTQVDNSELPGTINFGGFTDGDRAVQIVSSLGAGNIYILGFDFENVGKKIGNGGDRIETSEVHLERKRKKLGFARRIVEMVTEPVIEIFPFDHDRDPLDCL